MISVLFVTLEKSHGTYQCEICSMAPKGWETLSQTRVSRVTMCVTKYFLHLSFIQSNLLLQSCSSMTANSLFSDLFSTGSHVSTLQPVTEQALLIGLFSLLVSPALMLLLSTPQQETPVNPHHSVANTEGCQLLQEKENEPANSPSCMQNFHVSADVPVLLAQVRYGPCILRPENDHYPSNLTRIQKQTIPLSPPKKTCSVLLLPSACT